MINVTQHFPLRYKILFNIVKAFISFALTPSWESSNITND